MTTRVEAILLPFPREATALGTNLTLGPAGGIVLADAGNEELLRAGAVLQSAIAEAGLQWEPRSETVPPGSPGALLAIDARAQA